MEAYIFGNNPFTYDVILAVIFLVWVTFYLIRKRKTLSFERMAFPIFYAFLHREKYGIKWMEKFAQRHKQTIILLGYIGIGIGFVGMILAILLVIQMVKMLIFNPSQAAVAPFIPFINVPSIGYVSFTHWIITLFVVVIIHEAAHGIVALAHGQSVKNTGFGVFAVLIPFIPLAFVEPDEKEIKKQKDVVQYSIFAAGPFSNFILAIPLLLLLLFVMNPIESRITTIDGFTLNTIEGYPAEASGIVNGTLFNYVNGREMSGQDFLAYMRWVEPNQLVQIGYRNGTEMSYLYDVTAVSSPADEFRGFIGVQEIDIVTTVSNAPWVPFFSWFKGLLLLLFVVTVSLGVINLFPAGVTDGGQMLKLSLEKVGPNEKVNQRVLGILAIFFFAIILFAMITYFTGNPFSLIFG